MNNSGIREQDVIVRERPRGGFIAVGGRKARFCIGVIADSEQEARKALMQGLARMQELRDADLAQQATN